jgi:hypothetical protein
MRFSFPAFRFIVLFIVVFFTNNSQAQQLSDEISSKLSEAEQKRLSKAENLTIKGDLQLSKANYPGDKQLLDMLSMGETKELRKYAGERLIASSFYKDANSGKFLIYEKNCNEFWKKYTGNKAPLDIVKQSQLKAIQQFNEAQETRKSSDKNIKLNEKLSLLFDAETKEKESLSLLQKVLFVYLNYPVNYNSKWFSSADTIKQTVSEPINTGNKVTNNEATPVIAPVPVPNLTSEIKNIPDTAKQAITKPVNTNNKITYNEVYPVVTPVPVPNSTSEIKNIPDTTTLKSKKQTEEKKIAPKANETAKVPGDSSLYMMANVKEDQIDQFNSFLQKNYPDKYENYIINFQNIDYSNIQSLRNAWYQYRFGVVPADSLTLIAETKQTADTITKGATPVIIAQNAKVDSIKSTVAQPKTKKVKKPKETNKGVIAVTEKQKTNETEVIAAPKTKKTVTKEIAAKETKVPSTKPVPESIATGFLYRIQVAASRVPLSETVLKGIYPGQEKIIETSEDNWYKYTIGEFNTYSQARQLRDNTNVPGVFVVAYLNGKRIKITSSFVSSKLTSDSTDAEEGIQPDKIVFRIQLVASKKELSASTLKNIYNGSIAIDTIQEDGWLKYSLLAGNKLSDALELLKSINVPGAFIVSYYNNQKLNLHTAIKLTKKN